LREFNQNLALSYYEGSQPRVLKVDPKSNIDDNLFIPYAEMIVDKGVEFLFGDELKIEIEGDEGAQKLLDELWHPDTRAEDLIDLATDGAIFGDAWLKIFINDRNRPEIAVLDPTNWHKITDPGNYKKTLAYRCQYKLPNGRYFREETREIRPGFWETQTFESADLKKWTETGEPSPVPFPGSPVLCGKNLPKSKSTFGRPDLTKPVLDLCKYIARCDSLIGKILRVHASPKSVASGLKMQDLQVGVDSTLFLPNAEAKLQLLEMTGDLAGALAYRKQLREALSEISKIPEIATGKMENTGSLSGFALEILYGPLIKLTSKKRRLYGRLITEAARGLMLAGGFAGAEKAQIKLHWGAAIPQDPLGEAQLGLMLAQNGVSQDTILQRLGFDPEAERTKRELEQEKADERRSKIFNAGMAGGDVYAN
jgi:hypothetical protein